MGDEDEHSYPINFSEIENIFRGSFISYAKWRITHKNASERDPANRGVAWYLCAYGPDRPDLLVRFMKMGAELNIEFECEKAVNGSSLHQAAMHNKPKLVRAILNLGVCKGMFSRGSDHWCSKVFLDAANRIGKYAFSCQGPHCVLEECSSVHSQLHWSVLIKKFLAIRECVCEASIVILGLQKSRSQVVEQSGNGVDVLRIIARCVWSTRTHDEWEIK